MKSRKNGFTLIELLVVVAIIALLIAILLPSLGKARDQAKTVKCSANIRSLYQALNQYQAEWNGFAMPYKITPTQGGAASGAKGSQWIGPTLLGSEMGKSMTNMNATQRDASYRYIRDVFLHCPADPMPGSAYNETQVTPVDYAYNANMGDSSGGTASLATNPYKNWVAIPRQTLLAIETHQGGEKGDKDWFFKTIKDLFVYDNTTNTGLGRGFSATAGRIHAGGTKGNMLFADGQIIVDDPQKMNTTGGVIQSIAAPNGTAGDDCKWVADPYGNTKTAPFPFEGK